MTAIEGSKSHTHGAKYLRNETNNNALLQFKEVRVTLMVPK